MRVTIRMFMSFMPISRKIGTKLLILERWIWSMENMLSSVVDIKVSPGSKERKAMMPRRDAFVSVKRPATSETKKENSPTSRPHAQISEVKKLKHNINSSTRCTCVHPSDLSQLLKIIGIGGVGTNAAVAGYLKRRKILENRNRTTHVE